VIVFYSKVSKVAVKRDRFTDPVPNGVFIYFEIMFAAFGFLYIDNLQAVPLNDDLRLQRVPLFFPE
jgi:hypothetical protein